MTTLVRRNFSRHGRSQCYRLALFSRSQILRSNMSTVPLDMSNGMSFPKEPPLPPIHRGSVYVPSESGRFSTASQNDSAANNPAFDDISMSISGKLSNVEAQRIISVLQEIQRKVQLIGLLPDVIDKRVSAVFGGETFNLIKVDQLRYIMIGGLILWKTGSPTIGGKIQDVAWFQGAWEGSCWTRIIGTIHSRSFQRQRSHFCKIRRNWKKLPSYSGHPLVRWLDTSFTIPPPWTNCATWNQPRPRLSHNSSISYKKLKI